MSNMSNGREYGIKLSYFFLSLFVLSVADFYATLPHIFTHKYYLRDETNWLMWINQYFSFADTKNAHLLFGEKTSRRVECAAMDHVFSFPLQSHILFSIDYRWWQHFAHETARRASESYSFHLEASCKSIRTHPGPRIVLIAMPKLIRIRIRTESARAIFREYVISEKY